VAVCIFSTAVTHIAFCLYAEPDYDVVTHVISLTECKLKPLELKSLRKIDMNRVQLLTDSDSSSNHFGSNRIV
jgi:hypothetical protein